MSLALEEHSHVIQPPMAVLYSDLQEIPNVRQPAITFRNVSLFFVLTDQTHHSRETRDRVFDREKKTPRAHIWRRRDRSCGLQGHVSWQQASPNGIRVYFAKLGRHKCYRKIKDLRTIISKCQMQQMQPSKEEYSKLANAQESIRPIVKSRCTNHKKTKQCSRLHIE